MAEGAYPNPDLLVDTAWLAAHLEDTGIRIVDCDNRDAYRRAHIPGAVSPREHYMKGPDDPLHIMGPEQFAREMGEMGIGDETLVVCYDGFGSLYSARFWWCLRHYGHERTVVVNGGWQKWLSEGRPVTYAEVKPAPAVFTPRTNEHVICRVDDLKALAGGPAVIWDVRSEAEWTGANDRGNKRAGHVPGAVHLEWLNCVTKDEFQTIRPANELRTLLEGLGITPESEVVTY
jgi:thiosulfate/3-mercaptopyruvate sulfurtransferase